MIIRERGPVYGILLLDELPIGGGMKQAMPSRQDLQRAAQVSDRVVAGYEVLTDHYQNAMQHVKELEAASRITTRCPSCHETTLVINNGHLLCTWHKCPDPTLIDRTGTLTDTLNRVSAFANKMSRSGAADRARAGNDMLELLAQLEFNPERNQSGEETKTN